MIQTAIDYAKELHKAGMTHEELSSVKDIFDVVPQVKEELNDPTVSLEKKHLVIQKVFSKNVRNFLQLLCDNNDVNLFEEVYKALTELEKTPEQKESSAVLTYVEAPSDEQLAGIKKFIEKEFHNPDIKLEMVKDPSLKSGFVLKVGSKEYDWSEKARIDQLKSSIAKAVGTGSATASEKGILSILEANIEDFQLTYATLFGGVRHDSGDPYEWGDKMIKHYESLGIDAANKTLLFSDSLDFDRADKLYRYFNAKAKVAFGIGTYISNDTDVPALNIVMKTTKCNGMDVAKISDNPGKGMCKNPEYVEYLQRCIDWRMNNDR